MSSEEPFKIKFVRNRNDAVIPTKAHPSDTGFDLTAVKVHKELDNGVILYDTGISVCPPNGYYTEIVPRSSISKTGWMLANNIGIIDSSYTGNLLIALVPTSSRSQPLELPFCKCQLILRKLEYAEMVEVSSLDETERGDGGFGSTDG